MWDEIKNVELDENGSFSDLFQVIIIQKKIIEKKNLICPQIFKKKKKKASR